MNLRRFIAFTLWTLPSAAFAVDLQPNDIVAPLPGKSHAMISYLNTESGTFYKNGAVVSTKPFGSPDIGTQSAILRVSTSYAVKDLPAISYLQLPYGSIKPEGSLASYPSSSGIGDLTLATAFWPYADREKRRYFGVAGYFTAPTGSYNSQQVFNVSENRYRSDVQMGYQQPIVENLDGMIAVDTMWFGGNSQCAAACFSANNTSLNQKPLTTTQLGPIYKINQTYTLGASYFYVAGGATTIGNTYQNNVMNTQRFLLSALAYYPFGRISLQYGRDMEIKNGFVETRRFIVRYTVEL
ncbi:transporter [Polynucleobacter sp. JS-Safj-400b-B2]|uniref:transporter n=1 Tax=Polynucleobacter sp. JS-Safj-400b-B2 TaxID=2576921 RepID=UPI001C0CDC3B|nr:transporter [Polynucleobacter sp. JS-Safj-400b-B2]MBU3624639.1 transporter [Polynucleobacter sp. JS-Safj-400b-B2]